MTDIGTVLGGRYRLVELLGQGGMATIYRARDAQLERDVAVKVLRPEYGADPDFLDRFRHEAQSAASLNHPSVVAVYDYGTDTVGPFIVMELVEGEDLATILKRAGTLPPRAAARLVAQAARAIAAAHDRGFVHRDIKPGNILVTREGRVKVADFGIARALSESALTLPGTTLGSVHYFSPEQARGELASPASDIYSLGIVLFELLTGRRPWTGDTAAAIATARLTGPVPSPSAVHAGIPPALEAIAQKALATNPADRFASAAEMAVALEQFLGESGSGGAGRSTAGHAGGGVTGAAAAGAGMAAGAAAGAAGAAAAGGAAAGAGGVPTAAAGVARPNPEARIDYPRDAYASAPPPPRGSRAAASRRDEIVDDDDGGRRTSPWLWVSAVAAIAILALAAFALVKLMGGPSGSPKPQVVVPNLVGMTFVDARAAATAVGLEVVQVGFEETTTQPVGTVVKQDPLDGASVEAGSEISLTMAISPQGVAVPDLRGRLESEAVNLIAAAKLTVGTRTEEFDPIFAVGTIISHSPGPNQIVVPGSPVSYVVSKGPEPTPTPSPTPPPTAPPTAPPPTAPPTVPPTPAPINVGDYRCVPLAIAEAQITADGFTVGSISGPNDPSAVVVAQAPAPGAKRAAGTSIDLTTESEPVATCPAG